MDETSVLTLSNLRSAVLDLEKKYGECGGLIREVESIIAQYERARAFEEHKEYERKKQMAREIPEGPSSADSYAHNYLEHKPVHQLASTIRASPLAKSLSRKNDLLEHLLFTERQYFQHLVTITENYAKPLADKTLRSTRILPPKQWSKIFQNIEDIKEIHKNIWKSLEAALQQKSKEPQIAKIFSDNLENVKKHYAVYSAGFPDAVKWLVKTRKTSEEFLNFLNNVDERLVVGTIEVQWPLGALLFLPLVRISEYEGLLKEISFYTSPPESELDSLADSFKQLFDSINLKQAEAIKVNKIIMTISGKGGENSSIDARGMMLSTMVKEISSDDHSRLIRDCPIISYTPVSSEENSHQFFHSVKDMYLYLFPNVVVLAEHIGYNGERLFVDHISLHGATVTSMVQLPSASFTPSPSSHTLSPRPTPSPSPSPSSSPFSFFVNFSNGKTLQIGAWTESETLSLLVDLREAIRMNKSKITGEAGGEGGGKDEENSQILAKLGAVNFGGTSSGGFGIPSGITSGSIVSEEDSGDSEGYNSDDDLEGGDGEDGIENNGGDPRKSMSTTTAGALASVTSEPLASKISESGNQLTNEKGLPPLKTVRLAKTRIQENAENQRGHTHKATTKEFVLIGPTTDVDMFRERKIEMAAARTESPPLTGTSVTSTKNTNTINAFTAQMPIPANNSSNLIDPYSNFYKTIVNSHNTPDYSQISFPSSLSVNPSTLMSGFTDAYRLIAYRNRVIFGLSDSHREDRKAVGGEKLGAKKQLGSKPSRNDGISNISSGISQGAADIAVDSATAFLKENQSQITDNDTAAKLIMNAFNSAHAALLKSNLSASLLVGMLLEVEMPKKKKGWSLLAASVGNLKAFLCSPLSLPSSSGPSTMDYAVLEITTRTAINHTGTLKCDPGGKLGKCFPQNSGADLRNFHLYYSPCKDGDIILVFSNGVADNLDPENLGLSPLQTVGKLKTQGFSLPEDVSGDFWLELNFDDRIALKRRYATETLASVLHKTTSPHQIVREVIEHTNHVTRTAREFALKYPNRKIPQSGTKSATSNKFVGVLDNATCLCFEVGRRL